MANQLTPEAKTTMLELVIAQRQASALVDLLRAESNELQARIQRAEEARDKAAAATRTFVVNHGSKIGATIDDEIFVLSQSADAPTLANRPGQLTVRSGWSGEPWTIEQAPVEAD